MLDRLRTAWDHFFYRLLYCASVFWFTVAFISAWGDYYSRATFNLILGLMALSGASAKEKVLKARERKRSTVQAEDDRPNLQYL